MILITPHGKPAYGIKVIRPPQFLGKTCGALSQKIAYTKTLCERDSVDLHELRFAEIIHIKRGYIIFCARTDHAHVVHLLHVPAKGRISRGIRLNRKIRIMVCGK